MGERPTIAFRVNESRRDEWQAAVADSAVYDSMSHLVRLAVQRELHGGRTASAGGGDDGGGGGGGLDQESKRALRNMADEITDISRVVGEIERDTDDLRDGLERVWERLRTDAPVADRVLQSVIEAVPDRSAEPQTAAEIAEAAGVSEREADLALAYAKHDVGAVERTRTPDSWGYQRAEGESWER